MPLKTTKTRHPCSTASSNTIVYEITHKLQSGETPAVASRLAYLLNHDTTGIVTPSQQFEHYDVISITSSLNIFKNNAIVYLVANLSELQHSITFDTQLADFEMSTPEQNEQIQRVDPASYLSSCITIEIHWNEILEVLPQNPEQDTYWFPTRENPEHTPIFNKEFTMNSSNWKKGTLELKPTRWCTKRIHHLKLWLVWHNTESRTTKSRKSLIAFNGIFARHHYDIGTNREFKVKQTPNEKRPAYSQSMPTPNKLKKLSRKNFHFYINTES